MVFKTTHTSNNINIQSTLSTFGSADSHIFNFAKVSQTSYFYCYVATDIPQRFD